MHLSKYFWNSGMANSLRSLFQCPVTFLVKNFWVQSLSLALLVKLCLRHPRTSLVFLAARPLLTSICHWQDPQVPVCGAVLQPFIPYSICTFSDALFHIQKLALVLAIFIKISDHVIIPSSSKQVSIHFMKPWLHGSNLDCLRFQ